MFAIITLFEGASLYFTATLPEEAIAPLAILMTAVAFLYGGFFSLQPNEARVLILFGKYRGTVKKPGLHWANPFYSNGTPSPTSQEEKYKKAKETGTSTKKLDSRYKLSLRARTEVGETIKVNDRSGNPIEIASVVVWAIADTAKAVFDVDDYRSYVKTQLETSLRHVATQFPYDHTESGNLSDELTLRGNPDEISGELRADLSKRLAVAGVEIQDARLTHLAYAPEIAQAMLRRQQADAIISARRKIVEGAVGMVEMALRDLEKSSNIFIDEDKKAQMVSNLMVVLVSEREASPVVNAGTLYS
jgi:regulator of protease activity HflC (stomatin/prohibitin superfamily)